MSGLFSGINTALKAILSQQVAMQVIEHNVANANNENYTRQEAVITAAPPDSPAGLDSSFMTGQIGTGSVVNYIKRYSLEFMDNRLRSEMSNASQWEMNTQLLSQIEATMAEAGDDGITAKLGAFWEGWQSLSTDPGSQIYRADLYERATNLVDAFHRRSQSIYAFREDQDLAIQERVSEINGLASQLARMNEEIARVTAYGNQPNDLLDQRDAMIDRLAEITGVVSHIQDDGSVMVSLGGHALVVGGHSFSLTTVPDANDFNLVDVEWEDGLSFVPSQGEMAGILEARDIYAVDQLSSINTLASSLIARVNTLHQSGYGTNNATSLDFFTGTDALSMRVSSDMSDLNNIAAAAAANSPGDNAIADQLAGVQNELLMDGGTSTLSDYYLKEVANLGLVIQRGEAYSRDRSAVVSSLKAQKESIGGVSLDEEAANLMKTQHAYNAAARLMTTVDEMIDTIVNRMGIVGR